MNNSIVGDEKRDILIKTKYNQDIRKLKLNIPIEYKTLREIISKNYNLKDEHYDIYYIDDEKDKITIGNESDLNLAVESLGKEKIFKINIKSKLNKEDKPNNTLSSDNNKDQEIKNPKKKLNGDQLIKIQKREENAVQGMEDLNPLKDKYNLEPTSNPVQPIKPFISFQPSTNQQYQDYSEDTKPMMKLNKPQQPIKNNSPSNQSVQTFIPFASSSNQKFEDYPEDTKPMMKLTKPIQQTKPTQDNSTSNQSFTSNQPIQTFIPFQSSSNQKFEDYPEDTKPMMKLNKPQQPIKNNSPSNQSIQTFIPFQSSSNQKFEDYPEDTKPMMKLTKPIQHNSTSNQSSTSNQPIQTFIPFQSSSNQKFEDYPEDTKPMMKLTKPKASPQNNFPYENQLKEILNLGFKDDEGLRNILLKNKGDVTISIEEIII